MMNVSAASAAMAGRDTATASVRAKSDSSAPSSPVRRGEDTLEVSPMASMLSKQTEAGERTGPQGIRTGLVDRVRREIAAGTYDSPEKLDIALDRMIDDLL